MLRTNTITATPGSRKKSKRLGRGNGSGKGTFSTRGMNGQNARSGWGVPDWFEGGQTPLFRRMPKLKGFSNARYTKHFNIINLSDIEALANAGEKKITKETLLENNIIRKKTLPIKLLGNGELTKKVELSVDRASNSALVAFEKVGGKLILSEGLDVSNEKVSVEAISPEKASKGWDDLTKVEGIGPKIAETLSAAGIATFTELAKTDPKKISEIIADVRGNHVPDTWPAQAQMAADRKWDELKKWQDELDGGK